MSDGLLCLNDGKQQQYEGRYTNVSPLLTKPGCARSVVHGLPGRALIGVRPANARGALDKASFVPPGGGEGCIHGNVSSQPLTNVYQTVLGFYQFVVAGSSSQEMK